MLDGTGQWRQRNGAGQPTVKVMESNTGGELSHLMKASVRTEGRCSWRSHQQQSPAGTTEVRHLKNPFIFNGNIEQCLWFLNVRLALLENKLRKEWLRSQVQVKGWCFICFLVMLCTLGNDTKSFLLFFGRVFSFSHLLLKIDPFSYIISWFQLPFSLLLPGLPHLPSHLNPSLSVSH